MQAGKRAESLLWMQVGCQGNECACMALYEYIDVQLAYPDPLLNSRQLVCCPLAMQLVIAPVAYIVYVPWL